MLRLLLLSSLFTYTISSFVPRRPRSLKIVDRRDEAKSKDFNPFLIFTDDFKNEKEKSTTFANNQVIFSSNFNITRILVPADGKYVHPNNIPSIFFTVSDPKLDGGSCIFVLQEFAAYEVLEGGRDSTADYGSDSVVYFGAKDGVYKYNPDSLSAKRYGIFKDDIIQLQKATDMDVIYILTSDYKIYKLEKKATVKTRVNAIVCALEFVLDTSNNIYYISCNDRTIHIVSSLGRIENIASSITEDFKYLKLLRPPFIMDKSVPFFGDGQLYIIFSNGLYVKKDFYIDERPSAFSVDTVLYLVVALNGKIYEFNLMDVLLNSMFGLVNKTPTHDITHIIISMLESAKEGVIRRYSELLPHIVNF